MHRAVHHCITPQPVMLVTYPADKSTPARLFLMEQIAADFMLIPTIGCC